MSESGFGEMDRKALEMSDTPSDGADAKTQDTVEILETKKDPSAFEKDVRAEIAALRERMDQLTQKGVGGLNHAMDKAEVKAGDAAEWGQQKLVHMRQCMQEKPLKSLMVAALTGLVFGHCLRR